MINDCECVTFWSNSAILGLYLCGQGRSMDECVCVCVCICGKLSVNVCKDSCVQVDAYVSVCKSAKVHMGARACVQIFEWVVYVGL